jgi:hypothetical protein
VLADDRTDLAALLMHDDLLDSKPPPVPEDDRSIGRAPEQAGA